MDQLDNEPLTCDNIILQYSSCPAYDGNGYLNIDAISGGEGKFITRGKAIDIRWEKDSPMGGITHYYDGNQQEIRLNPGTTWVGDRYKMTGSIPLLISKTNIQVSGETRNMNANYRERLKDKKRIVIKIGSSSLIHAETGRLDFRKLEILARELSDLHNQGKDVVLVSSGAIAVGAAALGMKGKPAELEKKQACAAVGQARLMTIYQKLFGEYNQMVAQILMTKNTMVNNTNRRNAQNTFQQLLAEKVIPIVNENDSVSSYEFQNLVKFGDNDTLSSVVAALIDADLLILMSDIDGLFTDDPNSNPDAQFIDIVENMDDNMRKLGKSSTGSNVGTGGMATKLTAAIIATAAGADMVIANGNDFHNIHRIVEGRSCGTLFVGNKKEEFFLIDYIEKLL